MQPDGGQSSLVIRHGVVRRNDRLVKHAAAGPGPAWLALSRRRSAAKNNNGARIQRRPRPAGGDGVCNVGKYKGAICDNVRVGTNTAGLDR